MTRYVCSECGLAVVVEDSINPDDVRMIKACGCVAPVFAYMESTLEGSGVVE